MPAEDHPQYEVWSEAFENLKDAKAAKDRGEANDQDVRNAQDAFDRIADQIDNEGSEAIQ